jgi:hypothetical protein
MKKWILTLISLGYLSPTFATQHDTFLVTAQEFNEISHYDHGLETPNFFTRIFPQNLNPNLVLIPRTNSGFLFGLTGFFQRTDDNQLDYAILDTPLPQAPTLLSTNSKIYAIKPDHDAGYGAYAGYIFPYTGRDVKLEVSNYDGGASDETLSALGNQVLWTPSTLYDQTITADTASTRYSSHLAQATLSVGQSIIAGTRFRLHPFMGLKYANLSRELKTAYVDAQSLLELGTATTFGDSFVDERSRFSGLGPAVGFDATYFLVPNFGIVGRLTNAILMGHINSYNRYIEAPDLADPPRLPVNTQLNLESADRAVPNVDGRLGLFYEHIFCGTATRMVVELGYQFNHFFNAIDTYRSAGTFFNATSDPTTTSVVTPLQIKQVDDMTIEGPYLSIGVAGLACPNNLVVDPVLLSVPRLDGGFILGLGAAYFRIQNNRHDYAILDPVNALVPDNLGLLAPPSLSSSLRNVQLDSAYGYMANIGYVFRDTPYDFMLSFQGANAHDDDKTTAAPAGTVWPILAVPNFIDNSNRVLAQFASAKLSFNYYETDAVIGQTINADGLVWLRLFEGIQYANINNKLTVTYNDLTNFPVTEGAALIHFPEETIEQTSYFSGFGPRVGFNMTLPVGGFALTSQLAGGLLLGSRDSSYKDSVAIGVTEGGLTLPATETGVQLDSDTHVSPFLDLRVGIGYAMNLWGKWSIDLGYQTTHYFNAATTFRHATNNAAVFVKQVDDVTIDGPYLNVSITGLGTCPSDCIVRQPYTAFVPELLGGFEFAAEYLYLQPHVSNLDLGMFDPTPIRIEPPLPGEPEFLPSFNSKVRDIKPGYASGTRLHLGYIIPLSASDVSINYTFYKADGKENLEAPPTDDGLIWTITNGNYSTATPKPPQSIFPLFAQSVRADANFDWNTANIELGRRVKFHQLMTRFFVGAVHANVSENSTLTYFNGTSIRGESVLQDQIRQTNSFSGYGPRFGMNADFNFGGGFSLVGSIATDLLIGKMDSSLAESSSAEFIDILNPDQSTRLLPAVDGKFGLAYSMQLIKCTQASVEAGYQINHYFNVKDSLRFTDYFSAFVKQDQDLSFDGFYARLQINL